MPELESGPTPEEARRDMLEGTLVERARALVALAWQVGSGMDGAASRDFIRANPDRFNATVLNGLVALVMVEVLAKPGEPDSAFYSPLSISKVLDA